MEMNKYENILVFQCHDNNKAENIGYYVSLLHTFSHIKKLGANGWEGRGSGVYIL